MHEPTSHYDGEQETTLSGVVAIVGCDGTGKSTLSANLLKHLRKQGAAERCYLGLISGEMGDKIKLLPVIGVWLERYLANKAQRAQDVKQTIPGTGTAIIMHILSCWRVTRLQRLIKLSQRGVLIVADRYPQAEILGFNYDGPGFSANSTDNWLLRKLAAREQRLYQWMSKQKPTLLIRLNIDVGTAHARKPDHSFNELRDKIEVMPRIKYNGANVIEIDASAPYSAVIGAVLKAVDTHIKKHI